MIKLKLAQYDLKTRKFIKFLECGNGTDEFSYSQDTIKYIKETIDPGSPLSPYSLLTKVIDKKDPLDRFDGFFNGRTYGDGEFVLIRESHIKTIFEDDVIYYDDGEHTSDNRVVYYNKNSRSFKPGGDPFECELGCWGSWQDGFKLEGSIHENPELYEKL